MERLKANFETTKHTSKRIILTGLGLGLPLAIACSPDNQQPPIIQPTIASKAEPIPLDQRYISNVADYGKSEFFFENGIRRPDTGVYTLTLEPGGKWHPYLVEAPTFNDYLIRQDLTLTSESSLAARGIMGKIGSERFDSRWTGGVNNYNPNQENVYVVKFAQGRILDATWNNKPLEDFQLEVNND